ncbi:hypothetical protein EZV62_004679 [Acer yangbiense]|uniref:Uncharacterized protein n=1 Tax=Acer yangbiense TaxID=1000413 RepID=A0A5C7ILL0_9ROSI|nr:hypothetical protein EZV62_004679 [Acer yangbiense]
MEEMERPEMRKLQKEQERERRRLRDRQRRQSMSVEEREKHLARRRRNYQLRRLRAENARLDLNPQTQSQSQSQPTTPPTDQIPPLNSVSDLSLQCTDVGSHQECTKSESLEVPAHKLAKFSGQLRLNRIKHLARSLNGPVGDNHKISVDVTVKGLEASNGISPKGLRLNRVKHLARSRNSAVKGNISQNQPSQIEECREQGGALWILQNCQIDFNDFTSDMIVGNIHEPQLDFVTEARSKMIP